MIPSVVAPIVSRTRIVTSVQKKYKTKTRTPTPTAKQVGRSIFPGFFVFGIFLERCSLVLHTFITRFGRSSCFWFAVIPALAGDSRSIDRVCYPCLPLPNANPSKFLGGFEATRHVPLFLQGKWRHACAAPQLPANPHSPQTFSPSPFLSENDHSPFFS
jgi:hypothetical protein